MGKVSYEVLGALGGVAFEFGRDLAAADALNQALTLRRCTDDDRARMAAILGALQRGRGVMIGLGVAGGALVTAGTALLVRGARNAPRPPGDDTAGPPPGQDPLAVTDKSPDIPPYTIPTPYGGPVMPVPMPN